MDKQRSIFNFENIGRIGALLLGGLTLVVIFVLLFWIFYSPERHFLSEMIGTVVQNYSDATGLNPDLLRGLVVVITIPFFWALGSSIWEILLKKANPLILYKSWRGIVVIIYFAAYWITIGLWQQRAPTYCVETPEGLKAFDTKRADPVYRLPSHRCSQLEIAIYRGERKVVKIPMTDVSELQFFDPSTRPPQPRIWYSVGLDGQYQLFDGPGNDSSGQILQPVTPGIVTEVIKQQNDERKRTAARELQNQEALARKQTPPDSPQPLAVTSATPIAASLSTQRSVDVGRAPIRGAIGITFQTGTSSAVGRVYGFKNGVIISSITPGFPAAKAGLEPGDVVISIDGRPINGSGDLVEGVTGRTPGSTISLGYIRNERKESATITVADREEMLAAMNNGASSANSSSSPQPGSSNVSPSDKNIPIHPVSGAMPEYSMSIQECYRASQAIRCWGYATNNTDALHTVYLGDSRAVDNEGNSIEVMAFGGGLSFSSGRSEKLIPNVPTRFFITVNDPHTGATLLNFQLAVIWPGRMDRYDNLIFKSVPVHMSAR